MRVSPSKDRRGAATVEFAVLAPVLVVLVLGMIEMGRCVSVGHSLQNAARAGCRMAIIEGATQSEINDRVAAGLVGTGISEYQVAVLPSPLASAAPGDPITVTVSAAYNDVSWLPMPEYLLGRTISSACSFPRE